MTRIARIADALGELVGEVVFIGGAIAPLLQTDAVIPNIRPTTDVDAVVASSGYSSHNEFETKIEARGFKRDSAYPGHAHRWLAPDRTPFDIVPAGNHTGGSGNEWDHMVLQTAVETEVRPGMRVKHASAMGFLSQKWAAYKDRGAGDPFGSEDLEDILALVVARPSIVRDFQSAPLNMQRQVCEGFRQLSANPAFEDLIAAHLANAKPYRFIRTTLLERIQPMMEVCSSQSTSADTYHSA
ncbi:MAG: hypothetical protein ACT4P6_06610 [Gemmatimonadaceae bacterium]